MDGLMMKYFVLKPKGDSTHAVASREAMRVYAAVTEAENPQFALELNKWVAQEAMAAKEQTLAPAPLNVGDIDPPREGPWEQS